MNEGAVLHPRNRCCCLPGWSRLQQLTCTLCTVDTFTQAMSAPVQVRCLNEAAEGSCRKVFKPWHQRLDGADSSSGDGGGQLGATAA